MDLLWKRVHSLLLVLMFWKHVIGHGVWDSQHVQPQHVHKAFSPRGVQSSVLEAPASVNLPFEVEEVNSNLPEKSLNPSRSRFSQRQFVKGGFSSSSESTFLPQSAPSGSVSASWASPQNLNNADSVMTLQLQGSSSSDVQDVGSQSPSGPGSYSQYPSTSKDRSGLQSGWSGSSVSTLGGSGLSPSRFSQYTPGSSTLDNLPVNAPSQSASAQSLNPASSQSSSDPYFGGTSSQLYASGSSSYSGSSPLFSASSQFSTGSPVNTRLLSSSGSLSSQATERQGSQGSSRPLLTGGSGRFVSTLGGRTGALSPQSQSTSGLYTAVSPAYTSLGSSPLAVSSPSVSDPVSQGLYTSGSQGGFSSQLATSYPSGLTQGVSSRFGGSYVQSQSSPSQVASVSRYTSVSVASPQRVSGQYNKATESAYTPSQTPPRQRLNPSASLFSQSIQPASTVSQSRSPPQGVWTSSEFSSPSSASGPSQLTSTQGASSYRGLSQSQSFSSPYTSGSPVYSKFVTSPLTVSSQFTSGLSSSSLYASSSQSGTGSTLAVSSQTAPVQRGSSFGVGSSPQPQRVPSQYAPAPSLNTKMPASSLYSQAASSGSVMSQSQPSRMWQPSTSRGTGGSFPASGVAVPSSPSLQSSQTPSRFLSTSSAGGPIPLVSSQGGSSPSQSLSTSKQYTPVSPAYAMFGSSPLRVSSQSTSGQTSSSQYTSNSQSPTGSQLSSSTDYLSLQRGSGFSVLSPGVQTSGTVGLQGSPSPQSSETSSSYSLLPSLSFPVDSVAQTGQTSVSRQTTGLLGLGLGPLKFSSLAAPGSTSSRMSPGLSASLQRPTGFMSPSSGLHAQATSEGMLTGPSKALTSLSESVPLQRLSSNYDASVQGVSSSQGVSSGSMSSDLTSELSSSSSFSHSQSDPVRPSRGSSTLGRYYSSVKG